MEGLNEIKLGEVSHLNVNRHKSSLMARQKPRKYDDYWTGPLLKQFSDITTMCKRYYFLLILDAWQI